MTELGKKRKIQLLNYQTKLHNKEDVIGLKYEWNILGGGEMVTLRASKGKWREYSTVMLHKLDELRIKNIYHGFVCGWIVDHPKVTDGTLPLGNRGVYH